MGQRTIKFLNDQFTNAELKEAFSEIKEYHSIAILKDGIVRTFANKIVESGISEVHTALRLAEEEILLRIAKRFIIMLDESKEPGAPTSLKFHGIPQG